MVFLHASFLWRTHITARATQDDSEPRRGKKIIAFENLLELSEEASSHRPRPTRRGTSSSGSLRRCRRRPSGTLDRTASPPSPPPSPGPRTPPRTRAGAEAPEPACWMAGGRLDGWFIFASRRNPLRPLRPGLSSVRLSALPVSRPSRLGPLSFVSSRREAAAQWTGRLIHCSHLSCII